jgi:NadR type nicotinamide-nucleotide adenylyltransferase
MNVLRVAILGAESSGKSTLAAALAARHGTLWVPEYLREFVDTRQRVPFEADQDFIAGMQMEREHAAARNARRYLFCDTTPFMTALYSRFYWHRVDDTTAALAASHAYGLTLVTAPDTPWEPDGLQRESAQGRQYVHEQVLAALAARGIAFTVVQGALDERLRQVDALLAGLGGGARPGAGVSAA